MFHGLCTAIKVTGAQAVFCLQVAGLWHSQDLKTDLAYSGFEQYSVFDLAVVNL